MKIIAEGIRSRLGSMSKHEKVLFSVVASSILIFSALFAFMWVNEENYGFHSPKLELQVQFTGNSSGISYSGHSNQDVGYSPIFDAHNMSNVSIEIFAIMPLFGASGSRSVNVTGSLENNSVNVELFNTSGVADNGIVHVILNKEFQKIIKEYRRIYTEPSEKSISISMTIDATYQFLYRNNTYIYPYYNNIQFNPWNRAFSDHTTHSFVFYQNILFTMSNKPTVIPWSNGGTSNLSDGQPQRIIGPAPCPSYKIVAQHVYQYWGPYPLFFGNVAYNSTAELAYSLTVFRGSTSFSIDSDQTYATGGNQYSSPFISSNPFCSYSSAAFSYTGGGSAISDSANPGILYENLSVIGFGHFEFLGVLQKIDYYDTVGSYCSYAGSALRITVGIENANNGSFVYMGGFLENMYHFKNASNALSFPWHSLLDKFTKQSRYSIPAGSYLDFVNYSFESSTFESAQEQQSYKDATAGIVLAALGLAFAIVAVAAAPETLGASSVLAIYGIAVAGGGITLAVEASQSVPAYTTSTFMSFTEMDVTNIANPGTANPMNVCFYEQSMESSWSHNGTALAAYLPNSYVYGDA
ncbi:MAG: hypothetical protein M1148_01155 [Candidatus Thermoplasmatota archaeon]|nr:hypothetical protein [Candidatus Thermoplasmatota archaeon]